MLLVARMPHPQCHNLVRLLRSLLQPGRVERAIAVAMLCALGCGANEPASEEVAQWVAREELPEGPAPGLSADARVETWELLTADQAAIRSPSDGGGQARIIEAPEAGVPAATPAKITLEYEAGPLGIAEGGVVFLQPSPFWDWDPPQIRDPRGPAYTTFSTAAEGVELEADDTSGAFLALRIGGRALEPGETIRFVYGDGPIGARVDRYAERDSPLYISVDGDGDGVRGLTHPSPHVDVLAHDPEQLHGVIRSTATPTDSVRITVGALDALGNAAPVQQGGIRLLGVPESVDLPEFFDLSGQENGHLTLSSTGWPEGIHRLQLEGTGELQGLSAAVNPIVVREGIDRVLWGDLHGHSQISDGTSTPDQYYNYARQVAGLDVTALTDHDHWGMAPLDADSSAWKSIRDSVQRYQEPERFVTLLGYEWTNWLHGHRHVLYFDQEDNREIYSSLDPDYDTPDELWAALRGQAALTFAHHSAGGPVFTNWRDYPPDPVLEPLTEIVSVHGSSEAADSPHPIHRPVAGNYVRDALNAGYPLGFIGSGDSHDGHPGLVQLADPGGAGGLAAIRSESLTREGVLEALRARRTYSTDGARIWLDVRLDDEPMGSILMPHGDDAPATQTLQIEVAGTAPIERIDLIRSGQIARIDGDGQQDLKLSRKIPRLGSGEYHYVRVIQRDGRTAWSSPIFAR
ncbi:CehA/McbA family metallohydrolase [Myxococcota bacterium]|nr:CehA/McbA family metallohydrolase [Myxococcota bacterium]